MDFTLPGYQLRSLQKADAATLQRLFDRCADYAWVVDGGGVSPTASEDAFSGGPPGRSLKDKFLFGLFDYQGELTAVLEGFKHYPEEATWWIGLLMLAPPARGQGIGKELVNRLAQFAENQGATALMLGVVEDNQAAYQFWQHLGFTLQHQTEPRLFGKKNQKVYVMRRIMKPKEIIMAHLQREVPFTIPPAQTAHIRRKLLDIAYARVSLAQKLDIYWPDSAYPGPFPVIISIHGGAFMGGDKGDVQVTPMLEGLKRGYAVVSINYRMSGEALFPALAQDAKAAVRWVRANAEKYQLDPQRIAAWGGSAGGWQAAMLGVSAGIAELDDQSLGNPEQPCHVQAVVDWFGPTDFLKMDEQLAEYGLGPTAGGEHSGPHSPESLVLGAQITGIPERVRAANPETYIRPGLPPFLIQHGTKDDTVPCLQSVRLAEKLTPVLGADNVTLELLDGARHADPRFETQENLDRVFAFLDKHLKK